MTPTHYFNFSFSITQNNMKGAREFLPPGCVDVIIYHNPCMDGESSAAVFHHFRKSSAPSVKMPIFIGMHPKDDPMEDDALVRSITNKNVILVDICFSLEQMQQLAEKATDVLILDHHVTNMETMEALSCENVYKVFDMDRAGIHLTWQYLYLEEEIPAGLNYIGLRDIWKHKEDRMAVAFLTGLEMYPLKTMEDWIPIIEEAPTFYFDTIQKGAAIVEYKESVISTMKQKVDTLPNWRGSLSLVFCNAPFPWISDLGDSICTDDPEHTVAVIWNKKGQEPCSVSLRSHSKVGPDVSKIAKEFGGGGHVHAAAFRIDDGFPFDFFMAHNE